MVGRQVRVQVLWRVHMRRVLWFLNRDLGGVVFVPYLLLVPGFASVGVMVAVRRGATGSADSFRA
jgi:hypothetical protein